jgi:hypothetical protein
MWIPFRKSKNAVKAAAQPRAEGGKFAAPPAIITARAVETESKNVSALAETLKQVQEISSMMTPEIEEGVAGYTSEWIPVIQTGMQLFAPVILKYSDSLMERFGFTANAETPLSAPSPGAPPSPLPSPNNAAQTPEPAAQASIATWISRAAKASPKMIKPFIPRLLEEVQRQGIEPEVFKKAVTNISKAI